MTEAKGRRRRRRLRARPLLVATGAALLTAVTGCGDDPPFCATNGICATDMAVLTHDMGLIGAPFDMRPRGD